MDTLNVITAVGVPTMLGGFIYVGRKLQILDQVQIDISKLKDNFSVIADNLVKNHPDFKTGELHALSPLKLTPIGDKLISDLGFDRVFAENKAKFYGYIESEHPKLKYDVELAAIKSISVLSDRDFMSFLKVFLYNNPDRAGNINPTLGVYIRERYLADHPEIIQ